MRKFFRFLWKWDGIWSIPIAVALFVGIGFLITYLFGPEAGMMLPAYVQRLFYVLMVMIFINFFVWFGMYINFPDIFTYYDKEDSGGFGKDFNKSESRMKWSILIYFGYFLMYILVLIFA